MATDARVPRDPGRCRWRMPDVTLLGPGEFVAVGADLSPPTVLAGYRAGLFAMPEPGGLGWWSPDPRGVLRPREVHVSRSLRRSLRRFEVSLDSCFDAVLALCADPVRPHGWISAEYTATYRRLHELGWAHSIEVWSGDLLAGGLLGVEVGGLFAAESKAHVLTDASKVAVVALADLLADDERRVIDVQWCTDHLASLGAVAVPRSTYLQMLARTRGLGPRLGAQPLAGSTRIRWRSA